MRNRKTYRPDNPAYSRKPGDKLRPIVVHRLPLRAVGVALRKAGRALKTQLKLGAPSKELVSRLAQQKHGLLQYLQQLKNPVVFANKSVALAA